MSKVDFFQRELGMSREETFIGSILLTAVGVGLAASAIILVAKVNIAHWQKELFHVGLTSLFGAVATGIGLGGVTVTALDKAEEIYKSHKRSEETAQEMHNLKSSTSKV